MAFLFTNTNDMPAGYSGTPLVKKLGIKEGFRLRIINEPENYFALLGDLPIGVSRVDSLADFIHFFTKEKEELIRVLPQLKLSLEKNGMLWVSWPKKASKVATDVSDAAVREAGLAIGLVDIKVCAVDEVWSGLKFVYRTKDR